MADTQVSKVEVHALTEARWADLETLFGSAAIPGRCWCMWWRVPLKEAQANRGEGNRRALRQKVDDDQIVGLLAYVDGDPAGWCSVGPRESFGRLERSPALTAVPGQEPPPGTWATVCFFVHRGYRRRKVAHALLEAAVELAARHGAPAFEAYPVRPRDGKLDTNSAFPGTHSMFAEHGFQAVDSKAPDRSIQMIMRRALP